MESLILTVHVLVALCIIVLVLLQHGKGADAGAAFGSGSSNTMFGSQGPVPFLVKMTAILAAIFFVTSLSLSFMAGHGARRNVDPLSTPVTQQQVPSPNLPQR